MTWKFYVINKGQASAASAMDDRQAILNPRLIDNEAHDYYGKYAVDAGLFEDPRYNRWQSLKSSAEGPFQEAPEALFLPTTY